MALIKERIYLSFTGLSVVLAMRSHGGAPEASEALTTFCITMLGTLLAVFTADVISTIAVTGRTPGRRALGGMAAVSFGALDAIAPAFFFLALAALGVWNASVGLTGSMISLIVGLVVVVRFAVRKTSLPGWQRLLLLCAESALGLAVIFLELLAHG